MRDRFDHVRHQERGEVEVLRPQLTAVRLEVCANERATPRLDLLDALESAEARHLLDEHTVETRVDPVSRDHDADRLAHGHGERGGRELAGLGFEQRDHLRHVPLGAGLDPAALPSLRADDGHAYVRAHLYETHDVWHVLTGFATDVAGELGLQAFYVAQLPGRLAPALVAGGLVNMILFDFGARDARMRAIVRGWLLGKRARPLFGGRWAELWEEPLDEVRRRYGLDLGSVEAALPLAA